MFSAFLVYFVCFINGGIKVFYLYYSTYLNYAFIYISVTCFMLRTMPDLRTYCLINYTVVIVYISF